MNPRRKTTANADMPGDTSRYIDDCGWIRGAEVEAARIAALVTGGMSVTQVRTDYPNLVAAQIDAAIRYADANPGITRSFPTRTAKSVLRDGGGGGLAKAFAAARVDEDGE